MLINQDFSPDRTKYIGGSDIGAILGLSKFQSPLAVWQEKTGKENKRLDSLPLRFGSFAEEFIAREYSRSTGFELLHDQSTFVHPQHPMFCAHLDRLVMGNGQDRAPTKILECKTANPYSTVEWGAARSDEVPLTYLCQVAWYQAITNIDQADLAVLFGNNDFRIYEIQRDAELEEMILKKALYFWQEHVLKNVPPPAQSEADCQTLFPKGDPTKTVGTNEQTFQLIRRLHLLNSEINEREIEISSIKKNLMNQMGVAETLTYQGKVLATWKAPKTSFRLDAKALEAQYPEISEAFQVAVHNSRRFVVKEIEM
jgi:putative phage-type endonuclease